MQDGMFRVSSQSCMFSNLRLIFDDARAPPREIFSILNSYNTCHKY